MRCDPINLVDRSGLEWVPVEGACVTVFGKTTCGTTGWIWVTPPNPLLSFMFFGQRQERPPIPGRGVDLTALGSAAPLLLSVMTELNQLFRRLQNKNGCAGFLQSVYSSLTKIVYDTSHESFVKNPTATMATVSISEIRIFDYQNKWCKGFAFNQFHYGRLTLTLAHEYYHVMQLQNGLDSGPLGIYDDARIYTAYRFQWFLALQSGASQSEIDLIVEKLSRR